MILDLQCNVMNRMKDDRKLESSEQQNNNTKKGKRQTVLQIYTEK